MVDVPGAAASRGLALTDGASSCRLRAILCAQTDEKQTQVRSTRSAARVAEAGRASMLRALCGRQPHDPPLRAVPEEAGCDVSAVPGSCRALAKRRDERRRIGCSLAHGPRLDFANAQAHGEEGLGGAWARSERRTSCRRLAIRERSCATRPNEADARRVLLLPQRPGRRTRGPEGPPSSLHDTCWSIDGDPNPRGGVA